MKKTKGLILSFAVILMLSACGQSEVNNEEIDNNAGGANLETSEANENDNNEANNLEDNNQEQDEVANNNDNESTNENEANEVVNEENNTTDDVANEENNNVTDDVVMIDPVTLYFSDDQGLDTYRVETTVSVTKDEAGAMKAMELWSAGPTHDGLYPLLPEGTSVEFVEFHDGVAHVSFSNELNDLNLGSGGLQMLTDQIAMMLQQFDYDQTQIMIEGEEVGEFQGHMDLSDPIEAGNPEDYEWME